VSITISKKHNHKKLKMALKNKLLILGLDSLPPQLTRQLAQNGTMPFINELLEKGSFGALRSIIPANTGGAWNSAWTGLKPESHGFFGFYHYDFEDDTIRISTSDRLKQPLLWDVLNQAGYKTLVINSPMQFPATPLDGVMVSGFMTPSGDAPGTWPREFQQVINREIPDYNFDVRWQKNSGDDATFETNIAAVIAAFEQRVQASRLAAATGDWDSLIIVFKSIDNMLHYTWEYLSDDCPLPHRRELTLEAFRSLDKACRALAELAGYPNTNILVCSDHGHGSIKGHLYINRWLAEQGHLIPQKKTGRFFSKLRTSFRKRIGIDQKKKKPSAYIGRRFTVEWEQSQAIMISSGVLYLNVQDRQPHGTIKPQDYEALRNKIAQELEQLTDEQGNKQIQKVFCPPEANAKILKPGEPAIPDILFEPADGVVLRSSTNVGPVWFRGHPDNLQGCHRLDGMVLGAGPAFSTGKTITANLYDIAPTALAACELPIPQGLTGQAIEDILADDIKIVITDQTDAANQIASAKAKVYNKDEEAEITQRLADLGYLE
jgi:predicted AlkP superfamily phosphohydrolase/phosphomutase